MNTQPFEMRMNGQRSLTAGDCSRIEVRISKQSIRGSAEHSNREFHAFGSGGSGNSLPGFTLPSPFRSSGLPQRIILYNVLQPRALSMLH